MSTMQDLTTAITAETAEEQMLIDALTAAKATGNQAAIDAAVAAINANTAKMQAALAPAVTPVP